MCFVFCATYSINWLVLITEMKSVYSAVRTGSLNKAVCASSFRVKLVWIVFHQRTHQQFTMYLIYLCKYKIHFHTKFFCPTSRELHIALVTKIQLVYNSFCQNFFSSGIQTFGFFFFFFEIRDTTTRCGRWLNRMAWLWDSCWYKYVTEQSCLRANFFKKKIKLKFS